MMMFSDDTQAGTNRRTFIKKGIVTAAGATVGAGLLADIPPATAAQGGGLNRGDAAILRSLSAVEQIEQDLWLQYAELGGVQTTPSELPGLPTGGSPAYTAALNNLDADMSQYIHDNTEDEFSHHAFINAFLAARDADMVDLSRFATLQGSQATGANKTQASDHEPHATHSGHQFLDPVSQPHEEPRPPRSQLRVSPSGPELAQW